MGSHVPWQTENDDLGPEVYETPDLIEDTSTIRTSVYIPETNDAGDIDNGAIEVPEAANVFRNESLATEGADFSDCIGNIAGSRGLIRQGRTEIEESREERINRLQDEVEEVRRELLAQGSDEDQIDELGEAIASLRVLHKDAAATLVQRLSSKPTTSLVNTSEINLSPRIPETWEVEKLEERIRGLEDALGLSVSVERSLLPAIEALEEKVDLLSRSPQDMEEQLKRIKKIHIEIARNKDDVESSGLAATDTMVNSIYELLPSLEKLAPVVPAMVERLRSLRHIHEYAADSFEIIETIQQGQEKTARQLQLWTESLDKLEVKVGESEERILANVEHTQSLLLQHERRSGSQ